MIRINLLPVRKARKRQAGQRQLLLFCLIIVVELVAMYLVYRLKANQVEARESKVSALRTEIDALKREVGDFDKLKAQRDRLIKQRDAIKALDSARTGPTRMLRELSDILSVGKGPTVDPVAYRRLLQRDPSAGIDEDWNPRKLWIEKLDEKDKQLTIIGKAKDHDDVAELLKRLTFSRYFHDVQLQRDDQLMDKALAVKLVRFSLTCRVVY